MAEDRSDDENLRRQLLASLKIVNRRLNRAPSDMTDRSHIPGVGEDLTDTLLVIHPVSGRELGRIVNVKL